MSDDTTLKLRAIQLDEKVITSISKNKKVVDRMLRFIDLAGGESNKVQGNLIYHLVALPAKLDAYADSYVKMIMANKFTKKVQIDEGIVWMAKLVDTQGENYKVNQADFEKATGVGINYSEADCQKVVDEAF